MRKSIVAGNWKMNGSLSANAELIAAIIEAGAAGDSIEVLVCPPAVYIPQVSEMLAKATISLGAQNVSPFEQGAYTGELSLGMLKEFGVRYVILGHSERRALFGEDDGQVVRKVLAALDADVTPILCVGETLEQREAGKTLEVVEHQLNAVLAEIGSGRVEQLVVAYEPVWAIGTGKTATPAQAQDVHRALRALIAQQNAAAAGNVSILYGGSVNAENAAELFAQPDIDGGLVGGASLKAKEFLAICSAAAGAKVNG